jgi:hypothetical protein
MDRSMAGSDQTFDLNPRSLALSRNLQTLPHTEMGIKERREGDLLAPESE